VGIDLVRLHVLEAAGRRDLAILGRKLSEIDRFAVDASPLGQTHIAFVHVPASNSSSS
jgi:hypothetical protein